MQPLSGYMATARTQSTVKADKTETLKVWLLGKEDIDVSFVIIGLIPSDSSVYA